MKNYWIAFLLFSTSLFWMNCNRPVKDFGRQQIMLPPAELTTEPIVLQDSFYVGDTIELVYQTNGISLFDTITQSFEPAKNLKFLSYKELGPPEELMFARMDISELEEQRRHVFSYLAKKSGWVTVKIQETVKKKEAAVSLPEPKSWKIRILKR
jgi:hypothetical protein